MAEIDVQYNNDGTVTIPVKIYRDLKRRAEKYDRVYESNAKKGSKRWAGTTPEQRKAHMAALAAKRKASS